MKRSVSAAVLMAWTAAAGALSMGPISGSTVIGRPLELSASIQFDELAQSSGRGCVRADETDSVAHHSGRLQLAVWDPNAAEASPWLRTSAALRSQPFADMPPRAAVAAVWSALNAQPQYFLRTAERLHGLEGEVSSLRTRASQHQSEITSARDSLISARNNQNLTLLLALLLSGVAGGGGAYLWHRARRRPAHAPYASWNPPLDPHEDLEVQEDDEDALPQVAVTPQPKAVATRVPVMVLPAATPAAQPIEPAPLQPAATSFALVAPPASAVPTLGMKMDALHGAQQQAEFFASLGQVEEAVAVLVDYIRECSEQPVLAYLELFRIYRLNGMRAEYEELQSQFRLAFDTDTMTFSEYKDDDRELDMYPIALGRVASAWPSIRSQEVIEELLFKRPSTPRDVLSFAAYRDLLWLYTLGQELVHSTGMPAGLQLQGDRGMPNDHFILPWATGGEDVSKELSLDRLNAIDVASGLNAFGVDIDLTAEPGEAMQQSWHDQNKSAAPVASAPPAVEETLEASFDSVMESFGRKQPR